VVKVETLMLANHVEAMNGLLYISGGGWRHHWRAAPGTDQAPPATPLGIAISLLIPWAETNRKHPLSVVLEPEDGGDPLVNIEGEFETGRPPGEPPGSDQRTVMALNVPVQYPKAGGYRVVARVGGGESRSVSFVVHDQDPAVSILG
jgi:hypothetical protein